MSKSFSKVFLEKFNFNDNQIKVETGKIATQSDQSFLVEWNETTVLVTVCVGKKPIQSNFLPLSIDFQENLYAAGKIPGSFFRREGKPSDYAVLSARIIDRSVRNLFPKNFRNEIQIIVHPLGVDYSVDLRVVSLFATSLVLNASPLPFDTPLAGVNIGYIAGKFICNPAGTDAEKSELEMFLAGNAKEIGMIEVEANHLSEDKIMEAINFGHNEIKKLIKIQKQILDKTSKAKVNYEMSNAKTALEKQIADVYGAQIQKIIFESSSSHQRKLETIDLENLIWNDLEMNNDEQHTMEDVQEALYQILRNEVRKHTLKEQKRIDGRKFDEIRKVSCEIDYLPIVHGSAIFNRGETQTLSIVTLGPTSDKQIIDNITKQDYRSFMHHYKSLPFAVGEVGWMRGVSRREIGHGYLGEKALRQIIPQDENFPYTIRVISEVMSSDGSTSQAAICSAVLSLKAAGVPIKATLAGIAIGLLKQDDKYHILSDIQAWEDFYGDMDFKIAGSAKGICAIQMDLKISGLPLSVVENILQRGRTERMKIIQEMNQVIAEPRTSLGKHAIKFEKMMIDPEEIGGVIGPSGKNIKKIMSETNNTSIDIADDGTILLYNKDIEMIKKAKDMIHSPHKLPEIGEQVTGVVTKIVEYGAFVKLDVSNQSGLIHISKLSDGFVKDINTIVAVKDKVQAEVIEINQKKQISLKLIKKI